MRYLPTYQNMYASVTRGVILSPAFVNTSIGLLFEGGFVYQCLSLCELFE